MDEKKELELFLQGIWKVAEQKVKAAKQNYEAGKRDCQAGVYDKWYRYHTMQDGRAYDIGWQAQNKITKCEQVKFLSPER